MGSARPGGPAAARVRTAIADGAREEFWRRLLEHSPDIVTLISATGDLVFSNPGNPILGVDAAAIPGSTLFQWIEPADRDRIADFFALVLSRPGLSDPFKLAIRDANGELRWLESVADNLLDDPVVAGIVVHTRDITERQAVEDALRASEERFRLVVENSTDVVTILNTDGTVRYTNPTYHRLTGYETVLDAGPDTWTDQYIHPDDRERVFKAQARALRTPGVTEPLEYRFQHADGHWLHFESVANNLVDDPRVRGVLVVSRDITEREYAKQSRVVNSVLSSLIVSGAQADLAEGYDAGLAIASRYQVLVTSMHVAGFELTEADLLAVARRAEVPPGSLCGSFGTFGVVIAPAHAGEEDPERLGERLLAAIADRVPGEAQLRLAVGSPRGTGFGIKASFDEAARLLGLGERLGFGGIITPRRAVIPALLDGSPSGAASLAKILQPLLAADERSRADLVETLRCYLANDSSVHKTAEEMHVHRNTVRARLRSIEAAIGGAIASEKVVLQLALLAHELTGEPRPDAHPSPMRSTSPESDSTYNSPAASSPNEAML